MSTVPKSLVRSWYAPTWATALLMPVSFLYRLFIAARHLLYKSGVLTVRDFERDEFGGSLPPSPFAFW